MTSVPVAGLAHVPADPAAGPPQTESQAGQLVDGLRRAWPQVLDRLRPIHGKAVSVWLDPHKVQPTEFADGILTLAVPNPLFAYTVANRLAPALSAAVGELLGQPVREVRGKITAGALREHERRKHEAHGATDEDGAADGKPRGKAHGTHHAETTPGEPVTSRHPVLGGARPFGTGFKLLEHFVVGSANRLAYEAIRHLLDQPTSGVNPVFIHGRSGLGKTHLEQGLALAYKERFPDSKVVYLRCEQFTNEWLAALEAGPRAINAFRVKMRHPDLLLIDDIHFLSQGAKPSTTKELYETFNALADQGKKAVFTSDASPKDIKYLAENFVQRFMGGLVVELQKPDPLLRRELVLTKARSHELALPDAVVDFVADRIVDNIRELEGAVNKLAAIARAYHRSVDLTLARQALADLIERVPGETVTQLVLREVADHVGIELRELVGKGRSKPVSTARHLAMYLLKVSGNGTYAAVGKEFGVGHTNVVYACEQAKKSLVTNQTTAAFVDDLLARLRVR